MPRGIANGQQSEGLKVQLATDGLGEWVEAIHGHDKFLRIALRKGRGALRMAGIVTHSLDMQLLGYHVWRGVSELYHAGRLDDDYLVAGDVLDQYVTDHDAEILVQAVPAVAQEVGESVGGMTPEVTAVHTCLLLVAGALREKWEEA